MPRTLRALSSTAVVELALRVVLARKVLLSFAMVNFILWGLENDAYRRCKHPNRVIFFAIVNFVVFGSEKDAHRRCERPKILDLAS